MSQLRQDVLTGRWVIVAAGRQGRPNEFTSAPVEQTDPADCPFCPGHEDRTTPEIMAWGRPDQGSVDQWQIRVFNNMYPALRPDPTCESPCSATANFFPAEAGLGAHEVMAYTPNHLGSPGTLSEARWVGLLQTIRKRMQALPHAHPGIKHILPFCNHGPQAGATLAHPHLQVLASPVVPALVLEKQSCFRAHHRQHGRCLLCDLVEEEIKTGDRLVTCNDQWAVITPWASRFPFEMRVIPRSHLPRLEDTDELTLTSLAQVLKTALASLEKIHQNLSYNWVIHTAPLGEGEYFHWHLEVLPRMARLAGFEAGSGFAINSIAPETAAARLRQEG